MTPVGNQLLLEFTGVKIGDYCHAHAWSDADPDDPWAVGYLHSVLITRKGFFYKLEGEAVPDRWFRYCEAITAEQGEKLLARSKYDLSVICPADKEFQIP